MLGFFGLFGRSAELKRLDAALRAADLHPRLVPEAVKLTALRLLQQEASAKLPPTELCAKAADLLAYCMLGAAHFGSAGELARLEAVEARIEAAVVQDGVDARLILLALQAGVIQPEVVRRFGLEAEPR